MLDFTHGLDKTLHVFSNKFLGESYTISLAEEKDLSDLIALEKNCWPAHLCVDKDTILYRIRLYPEGQFVVKVAGRIIGSIYTQKISKIETLKKISFDQVSTLHTSKGSVAQLLGISVLPEMQDRGVGDRLLEFTLQWYAQKENIEKIVAVTRCKNYQNYSHISLQNYIDQHHSQVEGLDPILRFHTSRGAKIVDILPAFRSKDVENLGAGILIEYDLRDKAFDHLKKISSQQAEVENISSTVLEEVPEIVYAYVKKSLSSLDAAQFLPTLPLRDIGFDSLGLLELRVLLNQHFNLNLDASFFFQYSTAAAIAEYIQEHFTKPLSAERKIEEKERRYPHAVSAFHEPIAIIGMACRFPGKINNSTDYWHVLKNGRDVVSQIPAARLANRTTLDLPFEGGYLEEVDKFDAQFFNIFPREAELMDPQQRILLEVSWEALEQAGIDAHSLRGTKTGVFMGIFTQDYETLIHKHQALDNLDAYFSTGNSPSVAAGRLSYFFGFQGPSLAINTACSSSLVAIHLACQSLRQGESAVALAGGVNLILSPELSISFSKAGMLSPDGRCKTFDSSANGYGRSEGCGVVILKTLSQALKDKDNILAVLKNTAVNQDGASNGLTAPNVAAQTDLIQTAFKNMSFEPQTISYVEAHGTGTPLGDPIEMKALSEIYGQHREKNDPLFIGSVKTNMGHTEAAAGIAGLLKVVLTLQNKEIPPQVHFSQLNSHMNLDANFIRIPTSLLAWPENKKHPRRAAVSSFGFSGTNAHAIVEEVSAPHLSLVLGKPHYLLTLSAKHQKALQQRILDLQAWIKENPSASLEAISFTLNAGRSHFNHRAAFVASTLAEFSHLLEQYQGGQRSTAFFLGHVDKVQEDAAIYKQIFENTTEKLKQLDLKKETNKYKELLEAFANLYVRGYVLDWHLLHKEEIQKRIFLPTYPFLRESYWIPHGSMSDSQILEKTLAIKKKQFNQEDKNKHEQMAAEKKALHDEKLNNDNFFKTVIDELILLFSQVSRVKKIDIDIDVPLGEYGMDSIMRMEMLDDLEIKYNTMLSTDLLADSLTIKGLAIYLIQEGIAK